MSCKFPSLLKCFLFTLKQATTNLACAPFFCFAVFFYSFYYCWPYMEQLPDHLNVVAVDQDNSAAVQTPHSGHAGLSKSAGHSADNESPGSTEFDAQGRHQCNSDHSA